MIKMAGRVEAIFCDHCDNPCETEVIEVTRYRIGEYARVTKHFCSVLCQEEAAGVTEKVTQAIDKGTRKEVRTLYKFVCPKCTERMRKFYEQEDVEGA